MGKAPEQRSQARDRKLRLGASATQRGSHMDGWEYRRLVKGKTDATLAFIWAREFLPPGFCWRLPTVHARIWGSL